MRMYTTIKEHTSYGRIQEFPEEGWPKIIVFYKKDFYFSMLKCEGGGAATEMNENMSLNISIMP